MRSRGAGAQACAGERDRPWVRNIKYVLFKYFEPIACHDLNEAKRNAQCLQNSGEGGEKTVLMETEFLNIRFPGSQVPSYYPVLCKIQREVKKSKC